MTTKYLASTITNYTNTIRTNVNTISQGLQTTCLELNEIGTPTGYTEDVLSFYGSAHVDVSFDFSTVQNYWIEEIANGYIFQISVHNGQNEHYVNGVYDAPYPPIVDGEPFVLKYYSLFPDYELYNQPKRYTYLQGVLQW